MISAPIFTYLVALIGLLFVAAGGLTFWQFAIGIVLVLVVERELFQVGKLTPGDDASDEPHHRNNDLHHQHH